MKRLRFLAPRSHVLQESGERIRGGGEFVTTDERAFELLTQPGIDLVEAPSPTSDLRELCRSQLNDRALEFGIPEPQALRTRQAVIAAIQSAAPPAAPQPEADAGEGQRNQLRGGRNV